MALLNLPSPQRTVRRGLAVCRRMNLNNRQALLLIITACDAAIGRCINDLEGYPNWLADVQAEARRQLTELERRGR